MKKAKLKNLAGFFVLLLTGCGLSAYLILSGWSQAGDDIWGHLYKAEYVYESLKKGILFPLVNEEWYNGIQFFRYWPPMSYYGMAIFMFLTGGKTLLAYKIYLGFLLVLGGIPWVLWGNIEEKRVRGTLIGCIWFFMPMTIRNTLIAGNLAQTAALAVAQYVVFFLYLYTRREKNKAAIGLVACTALATFTHLMIVAYLGITAFCYLLIDSVINRKWSRMINALLYMVSGIMIVGLWVVPAVLGGGLTAAGESGVSINAESVSSSQPLNPFIRLENKDTFYFGLAVLLISIFAILFARGKKKAGFWLVVFYIPLTSATAAAFLSRLPMGGLLWMERFANMVYLFFFAALMECSALKKKYAALLMSVLMIDLIPSFLLGDYSNTEQELTVDAVEVLRENTSQRAAILDLSTMGSYPAYGVCTGDGVNYTFGWAWQGAETASNIMLLNEALEQKRYVYLFDRCIELGDDTVLIQKIQVTKAGGTDEEVTEAAAGSGYRLIYENDATLIYKLEAPEHFGVISEYQGIAIGKYAEAMTTLYPAFEVGVSTYVDDYTYDDMKDYAVIFLSGFEYRNQETAENLIAELGESGVRVVIDTTHMPSSSGSKEQKFLNVLSQDIKFEYVYPELTIFGETYSTGHFAEGDTEFSTGYISYLDHAVGTFPYGNHTLTFYGYNDATPNVYFLGINLMYYTVSANDDTSVAIMDRIFGLSEKTVPVRQLVPCEVTCTNNTITVTTDYDNVNSTASYMDTYVSDREIREQNNLLVVDSGETVITLTYPNRNLGLLVTVLGLLLIVTVAEEKSIYRFCCEHYRKKEKTGCGSNPGP